LGGAYRHDWGSPGEKVSGMIGAMDLSDSPFPAVDPPTGLEDRLAFISHLENALANSSGRNINLPSCTLS